MKSIYSKTRVKVKLISRKPWEGVLEGPGALRVKDVNFFEFENTG